MKSIALAVLIAASPAAAHDWYPPNCCNGKECRPVACTELEIRPDGSAVYKPENVQFSSVQASQDAACHVCFRKSFNFTSGYCAFAPGMS